MTIHPAPCSLSINIHGDCEQANTNRESADGEEHISCSLSRDPVVQIIHKAESKEVLDKVHGCERFAGFLTMAVNNVRDDTCGAELDAKVDKAQANDHGDFPGGKSVGCLAPGEETRCGEEEVGYHDWKTEFGL